MFAARHIGFSLIELLVALSLLSIVLAGGFFFFNAVQEGYLREAGFSNQVWDAQSTADTLFVAFHDNDSFTAAANPDWPVDDGSTTDNESHFRLTAIWADNTWLNDNGSFFCRLTGLDTLTPSFTLDTACHDDEGVSATALEDGLTGTAMPAVILIGAGEPCIVTGVAASGGDSTFTIANQNCLNDADGGSLSTDASSGSGVIFPRFISRGARRAALLSTTYFDHFGTARDGAALYFGVEENFRDNTSTGAVITSDRGADNFSGLWVNIDSFNQTGALGLVNPRGLDRFSLTVEAVSGGTSIAREDAGSTAETPLYRTGLTAASLTTLLDSLHVNRPGEDEATLRFRLGAGALVWTRDLTLEME